MTNGKDRRMSEIMTFPETWEEFEKAYRITDREHVYTNGIELIPSFRVKQWLDHIGYKDIVRCKDCIQYNWETKGCTRNPSVEKWGNDDYCSYGERIEE